ncbi:acyl-CoA thioesterase [Litoribrevibacter albus]|uniref:Thioesterase n=1 Tax=Litoribrevibacter albus TaxID=1473156 RepID=A0AA37W8U9_9GAMM|nr:thioesterase family protein [Litoribrevibacter albus]GLQ32414.1 thioesterase [Litoribrevibacter albus]
MFTLTIKPRFCETDALGHINNTVVPMWFEQGREPIFEFFVPSMKPEDWNLIIARIEVDFLAQLEFRHEVEIKTWLAKIGNSSMQVTQEVWQQGQCCARGSAALIHFDYGTNTATAIPEDIRVQLEAHLKG